jgi:hypothetical protein
MSWLGKVGRQVAREHGHVAGTGWIEGGAKMVFGQWIRLRRRPCPKCGVGRLFPMPDVMVDTKGQVHQFVGCNACDHYEAAGRDRDPETITRLRSLASERFADPLERAAKVRQYKVQSRTMYGLALACLGVAIWLLVHNPAHPVYVNVALVGLFMIARAMRASYRGWQVENDRLFEPGLFRVWFNSGRWFL